MSNETNKELRELEMKVMDELQKVAAFGYSMANNVGMVDFMRLNNEAKATDYQQASHNMIQLLNQEIESVLDKLSALLTTYNYGDEVGLRNSLENRIQRERNKLKGDK